MQRLGRSDYIGGIRIDVMSFTDALNYIHEAVESHKVARIHTLNVDHVVVASEDAEFREAVQTADLVVPDGMPIVWILRRRGWDVERLTGADLMHHILKTMPIRVALVGGGPGVSQRAAQRAQDANFAAQIVLTASPSREEVMSSEASRVLVRRINESGSDVLFLALGSPTQELWLKRHHDDLAVPIRMGVGAGIDFLAGDVPRAPEWMQRMGCEWLFRLIREPRRLGMRYILRDWRFVPLVIRYLHSKGEGS